MSPDFQITLSLILTFGVLLVLAVRELRMLRYRGPGGGGRRVEPPAPRPNGDGSRPALPACLMPELPAVDLVNRARVLEPV